MTGRRRSLVTLEVSGDPSAVRAILDALQADWGRVLADLGEGDRPLYCVDAGKPPPPLAECALPHLPTTEPGARVAAMSPGFVFVPGKPLVPAHTRTDAERVLERLAKRYCVDWDELNSIDDGPTVRFEANVYPGMLADGRPAYR